MKIAVDCRYLGKSGIGRVCQGIIDNLDYRKNKYFLVGDAERLSAYKSATIIDCKSNPFSAKGLFDFPKSINKTCNAVIVPNFIIPMGIKIPVFSIMHDLIFLDIKGMTKGFSDKLIKKYLLKRCVKKSKKVFCVSEFTRQRCLKYYGKYTDKFCVNYNGLSCEIIDYGKNHEPVLQKNNCLVFVGNVKPHKGLKTLIDAFKMLPDDYTLKIIGEKDNFITGLDVSDINISRLEFTGKMKDEELFSEIANAKFLIQPSVYEGFGLPPLEAMFLGTRPIISDIEVFKEIYGDFDVEFFGVSNAEELKDAIINAKCDIKDCKEKILSKYNYDKCARTLVEKINE